MLVPNVLRHMTARLAINIDMVNPIPPRQAPPANCGHETPSGMFARPLFTANHENRVIPTGFPNTSPIIIPMLVAEKSESTTFPSK